ncbi:hypothetical protein [Pseudarcicella hirudinis]|uniref:hypothetical protein n=1 Tax=Pseudarcicella hirudinis TaxID=1079859 RepID=UPI000B8484C5|nr:hypothetical protein [Pseudarcicella hirudinis]
MWYFVVVTDNANSSCAVTTNEVSAKILKSSAIPAIVVITPQVTNRLIEVSKQGVVKLSAIGCLAFANLVWVYNTILPCR